MTNDNDDSAAPAEVASLDALLASIDNELAVKLEKIAELPTASQPAARLYADCLHRVQRTLAMWQFECSIKDRRQYQQIMFALADDMLVSGLMAIGRETGKAQRTSLYLQNQTALFKRLITVGAVAAPSQKNQARVLDHNGVPFRRKP